MHGNRHNRIEFEVAAFANHIFEKLGKWIVEKIVTLEFERVQQTLERSAIVAPCIRPDDWQRIFEAREAAK